MTRDEWRMTIVALVMIALTLLGFWVVQPGAP